MESQSRGNQSHGARDAKKKNRQGEGKGKKYPQRNIKFGKLIKGECVCVREKTMVNKKGSACKAFAIYWEVKS